MIKIITVIGTRPQFVKAAALSPCFKAHTEIDEIIVHTGQHYHDNMSAIFFNDLNLQQPHYNLNVGSSSHAYQTGQMLIGIEEILLDEKPDCVLVYGDTNSTLAGALAAVKLQIPIAHVEAGLRSFDHYQPEEINRVLTDRVSELLFTPSQDSANNLLREAIASEKIHVVGDIMFDVVNLFAEKADKSDILQRLALADKKYFVLTIHRAENTDNEKILREIVDTINDIATDTPVVFPIHPRTLSCIDKFNLKLKANVLLIEPLGFLDMMMLIKHCNLIMTDSGGLQKEAFYHRVPCITIREVTEWAELIHNKWNMLLPPSNLSSLSSAIADITQRQPIWHNPYGDGKTGLKIAKIILERFNIRVPA